MLQRSKGFSRLIKNPPASRKTWAPSLGWEDPLEKGKATHSSVLAYRISLTMKPQYFGHLTQRTDSLEKTLMLEKIEGRRRRG